MTSTRISTGNSQTGENFSSGQTGCPADSIGRKTEKRLPLPGTLSTSTCPCIEDTSRAVIANPNPKPGILRALSSLSKAPNIRFFSSSPIPIPVSRTEMWRFPARYSTSRNAWGRYGDENSGLYRYICDFYGIVYYSYGKYTSFDDVCQNALSQIRGIANKKYALDYILVDECQDFPESFFKLCEEVTSQKLYIAGDIFQSIFEEHVISDYSADYFLTKCYRTDPRTLMFAHALGLGLFEKRKLRWLRKEDWEACGYIYTEDNDKISLTREPVRRFSDVEDDYKSVEIKTFKEEDVASATLEVINNIQSENSDISINDLCIILLDDDNYIYNWANQIEHEISVRLGWEVNKAYETKTVIKDQLLLSNRNNVKGLEFPFVICITNGLVARESYRNSLYTMLTRSFIKSYLIISEEQAENATKLRHNYDLINALKALKFDKLSVEQQKQVETRFKKLKNRRPLADEIRDYLKNKGVEEKLIDKMVETALGMGWQDLDEDELQKKLDSFILIYGE